jgi:hypothetical protein
MSTIFGDKVTAGSVTFNDRPTYPVGATYFCCDGLDGWNRRPPINFNTIAIGGNVDGEIIASETPLRARHILASGYIVAEDRATAETLKDVLWRDAFPRSTAIRLTRYEPVPKFLDVQVSAEGEFEHVGSETYRWSVLLTAGDPMKYGQTSIGGTAGAAGQSTGGRTYPRYFPMTYSTTSAGEGNRISLLNAGNVASSNLQLTIHGPLTNGGWRVVNDTTGEELSFAIDLSSSDILTIDFREGLALLNGYPIGSLIIGDFWKLQTGVNVIKLYASYDPAVSLTAVGYSAWE